MSSVDDRIVNMKFNNSQFTQGVDKTKRDLTGLEDTIVKAGNSKGMTSLGAAADGVKVKFSALQVAGAAAMATIVSKATTAGLSLLKSFTIQPIIDGFKEYQTGLQSVQTIMSNTGKPVKAVNAALDKLNEYADKTIYNFAEMAKNVGTFTAAGVDLKTSVASIKGIANLAAMSGSTSQQASTAMYQLSQAISAGKVGLQDWNSVVNAGMGGKVFQTALSRTAQNMGSLSASAVDFEGKLKKLTVNGESFRQSISAAAGSESWLTGEVLVETLKQISGGYTIAELRAKGFSKAAAKDIDKLAKDAFNAATQIKTFPQLLGVVRESIGSTFASLFRTVIGDFTQSKKLWGDVGYSIIGPHGWLTRIQDGLTGAVEKWAKLGGRDKLLKAFGNLFGGLGKIVGAFTGAFKDIFPPATGNTLLKITKAFKRFTEFLVPSKATVESLRSIFGGFFAVLHIGTTIIGGIFKAFSSLFGALFKGSGDARGGVLSLFASIGEILIAFDAWLTKGGKLSDFMGKLGTVVGAALSPILAVIGLVVKGFAALASGAGVGAVTEPLETAGNMLKNFATNLLDLMSKITAPFEKVSGFFSDLRDNIAGTSVSFDGLAGPIEKISGFFVGIKDAAVSMFSSFDGFAQPFKDLGNSVDGVTSVSTAVTKIGDVGKETSDKLSGGFDSVTTSVDKVKGSVTDMYDAVSGAGADAATTSTDAVSSGAEGVGSAFEKVGDIVKKITGGIGDAFGWMVDKLSKIPFPDDALEWATVLNALISGALIKRLFFSKGLFGTLSDTIAQVGTSITDTFSTMQQAIKAEVIKNIAIAIAILVASLVALSFIPKEKLAAGLTALAITMGMMGVMMKVMMGGMDGLKPKVMMAKAGGIATMGTAMVLMATSILILAAAIAILGNLDPETLKQGMTSVAIILGVFILTMLAFTKLKGSVEGMAASMLIMAIALNVIVSAVTALGLLPFGVIKQGIGAMAAILGVLVLAMLGFDQMKGKIEGMAASMLIMAIAMNVMALAITTLGLLPYDVVEQGIITMALILGVLLLAMLGFSKLKGSIEGMAVSMLVMAVAINVLGGVLAALGVLPFEVILKGILAIALALGVLLIAAFLAEKVAVGLALLGAVIFAIGAAMLMAGAGMFLFASGLAIMVAVGVAAIAIMVLAIEAFIALLPSIAVQVAAAFVAFIQAMALASPKIRDAMSTIFEDMLGVVEDAIPEIGDLLEQLIETGLDVLVNSASKWAEAGFTLIDNVLNSAEEHVPDIVDSATELITTFIEKVGEKASDLAQAGLDLVVDVLNGISDAIENTDKVRKAAGNLARTFVDELAEMLQELISNIDIVGYLKNLGGTVTGSLLEKVGLGKVIAGGQTLTAQFEKPFAGVQTMLEKTVALVELVATKIQGIGLEDLLSAKIKDKSVVKLFSAAEGKQDRANVAQDIAKEKDTAARKAEAKARKARNKADAAAKKAKKTKGKEDDAAAKRLAAAAKRQEKAARPFRNKATQAQNAADRAQTIADNKLAQAEKAKAFSEGSFTTKGDMRSEDANALEDKAVIMLARAKRKMDEAKELAKTDKKAAAALRRSAMEDAKAAKALAKEARDAQQQAMGYYDKARKEAAAEVTARMSDIRKRLADEEKAREWQNKFEKADTDTKKTMLETRAADFDKKAQAALVEMEKQFALAEDAKKKGDYEAANLAVDAADAAAQEASNYASQAEADRDQIQQLLSETNQGSTGSGSMTPSRTALEDAALAVDRYTASVAQAEEMAQAAPSTTQFVQNNYSPESLSPATIYRQSKNLLSSEDVKMGANT